MIKICLVDDESYKIKHVLTCISNIVGINVENVHRAPDILTARSLLKNNHYDLLILDLILPERIGDDPKVDAGSIFLKEIKDSKRLIKPKHIIALTAYDEASTLNQPAFEESAWWIIKYDAKSDLWAKQLKNKIEYIISCNKENIAKESYNYNYDVAIITALHAPELSAIKRLNFNWDSTRVKGDSTEYLTGLIKSRNGEIKVVAASASQMGIAAATVLSMKIINNFTPKYIAMVGIAAGIKDTTNFGDILIAEYSWDYNSGKVKADSKGKELFEPDPKPIPLESTLRDRFAALKENRKYLDEIKNGWIGEKPMTSLNIQMGSVVSGAAVVQNNEYIQRIQKQSRKIVGVEMETYGMYYAASNCPKPRPIPFSIKSVCDFANADKNDKYQTYAAYTSSAYLYNFIANELSDIMEE